MRGVERKKGVCAACPIAIGCIFRGHSIHVILWAGSCRPPSMTTLLRSVYWAVNMLEYIIKCNATRPCRSPSHRDREGVAILPSMTPFLLMAAGAHDWVSSRVNHRSSSRGSRVRRQRAEGESQGTSLASFAAQVNHNNIKFDFQDEARLGSSVAVVEICADCAKSIDDFLTPSACGRVKRLAMIDGCLKKWHRIWGSVYICWVPAYAIA